MSDRPDSQRKVLLLFGVALLAVAAAAVAVIVVADLARSVL